MTICRLCGSEQVIDKFDVEGVIVEECPQCGFVQVRDILSDEEVRELYSEEYFRHGKYADGFSLERENQYRIRFMTDRGVAPGAKVLEVGCGPGHFLRSARFRFEMWGLDVSEAAVREARHRVPELVERIQPGTAGGQTYPEGFFDAIVMWDVIEHLGDPVAACQDLLKALRPGGDFFVSTPDIGAWVARAMGRHWALLTVPEHLGFFDQRSLRYFLERRLSLTMTAWRRKGKWVNLGFLLYKLKRKFPRGVPQGFGEGFLKNIAVYVPTRDIQYAAARKAA